ncbi:25538_t:CDS:2, partial [Dentiscutata erythropus]
EANSVAKDKRPSKKSDAVENRLKKRQKRGKRHRSLENSFLDNEIVSTSYLSKRRKVNEEGVELLKVRKTKNTLV